MVDALTADGTSFTSNAALARAVGVHRDQVRQWRLNGGPHDLSLAAWRRWLTDTGRTAYAEAIPASLAAADEAPPAAEQRTIAEVITPESEGQWKARRARAEALAAERKLDETEGRLVDRATWERALARLGAAVVECLVQSRPWDQLAPELDGLTPAQRQAMRAAYDRWVIDLRSRLAVLPRHVGVEVLPPLVGGR